MLSSSPSIFHLRAFSRVLIVHAGVEVRPPLNTALQMLGQIIWRMQQSSRRMPVPLGNLEWLVMPTIPLQQFQIFYKGEQPAAVLLSAQADEIVAKRIDVGDKRLTPAEWRSGTQRRIVDVVAPFGGEVEMRTQLID